MCAAPLCAWRTTNMSACIAARLSTVSSSVSPFAVEEVLTFRLITSAESRFAAISNVVRVRVEFSKKTLNTLMPRSSGTFFTSRSVTPRNDAVVSRMRSMISRGSPSSVSRCASSPLALSWGLRIVQAQGELPAVVAVEAQHLALRHRQSRAAVLRADRQLPLAAVDERHQRDRFRPAVVEQLIHRRADGAPGIEDVVDEEELLVGDVERDLACLDRLVEA